MNKKIQIFNYLIILLFVLLSCEILFFNRGIKVKTNGEIIELKGFNPIKGKHCESTSMMNALNYQGTKISEPMINGLSSSFTTDFIKEGGFPFLGCRITNLKENFSKNSGIKIVDFQPENSQDAYDWVKEVLKKNIPVVLRVDIKYLPYRNNGKYGKYSFGWHFVTLVKLDEIEGYAYVTETDEFKLKEIEKIKITDLMKARDSKEGFLKADNYCYYFEIPDKARINYKNSLKKSIKILIEDMNNTGLKNLKGLEDDILNIEKYIKTKHILKSLFFSIYGYIELFGTGGSAFRNFYRDYLIEVGDKMNDNMITDYAVYIDRSAKKWKELALQFKYVSENIGNYYNNEEKRKELYIKPAKIAGEIYLLEKEMIEKLEELYDKI